MKEASSLSEGMHVYMLIRSINQTHVPRAEAGPYTEVIYHRRTNFFFVCALTVGELYILYYFLLTVLSVAVLQTFRWLSSEMLRFVVW
jgi:hypothetical protein